MARFLLRPALHNSLQSGGGGDPELDLTVDLVSWWTLDEVSGQRNDSHGTNHLTDLNTVTSTTGKQGNAASFASASSEALRVLVNATLVLGDFDFTYACWARATTLPNDSSFPGILARDNDAGNRQMSLICNGASDRFEFRVFNTSNATIGIAIANSLGAPSTGTWYYIIAWHDAAANTLNIQVDNATVDSVTTSGGVPSNGTSSFDIGRDIGTRYWNGLVDEVGFWTRTLTEAERSWLFNAGAGRSYADLSGA